ncbi:MAG: rane protein [Clostridiales bacterium]|nr:rane protein [Clostridiales bacterium]
MKKYQTNLLKTVVYIGGLILTLFIFLLPWVVSGLEEVFPIAPYLQYLGFIGLYGSIVPFLFGLYQTLKFIGKINKSEAFSQGSVRILDNIRYSAGTISGLYLLGMPLLFSMAQADDAPGLVLFALMVLGGSVVTTVFANIFRIRCSSK